MSSRFRRLLRVAAVQASRCQEATSSAHYFLKRNGFAWPYGLHMSIHVYGGVLKTGPKCPDFGLDNLSRVYHDTREIVVLYGTATIQCHGPGSSHAPLRRGVGDGIALFVTIIYTVATIPTPLGWSIVIPVALVVYTYERFVYQCSGNNNEWNV